MAPGQSTTSHGSPGSKAARAGGRRPSAPRPPTERILARRCALQAVRLPHRRRPAVLDHRAMRAHETSDRTRPADGSRRSYRPAHGKGTDQFAVDGSRAEAIVAGATGARRRHGVRDAAACRPARRSMLCLAVPPPRRRASRAAGWLAGWNTASLAGRPASLARPRQVWNTLRGMSRHAVMLLTIRLTRRRADLMMRRLAPDANRRHT